MARLAALCLIALAFLPLTHWLGIAGGPAAPGAQWLDWLRGIGVCAGLGVVLAWLVPRVRPEHGFPDVVGWWWRNDRRADLVVACVAATIYAVLAHWLFAGRPAVIDEVVALWQAELLARGAVSAPPHGPLAAILTQYTAPLDGRIIGHYPPGGPLLLVPGVWLGAVWLIVPLWGGGAVYAWARLVRRIEMVPSVGFGAVLLLALSGFLMALAASQLSHVPAVALLLMAGAAFAAAVRDASARPRDALLAGLGFGAAALLRPMEAVAFAIPAGTILLWRSRHGGAHLRALLLAGAGVAAMIVVVAILNWWHTGSPWLFGYIAVWGPSHAPGFHEAPWGPAHTPAAGVASTTKNLWELQRRVFESPLPALLAPAVALGLWRRRPTLGDRWLIAGSGLLIAAYWAYWHDGRWLGPRFHLPLVALVALWTARLPQALGGVAGRVAAWSVVVAVLWGGGVGIPAEYARYRQLNSALRTDVRTLLAEAGIDSGVVLVRDEPWRVAAAELRAAGVPAQRARRLATRDPCAARVTARRGVSDTALVQLVRPTPGESMRCGERRDADATGADASAAILLGSTRTRRVVRDRGARNTEFLDEATARARTWVLSWTPGARRDPRVPHLVRLDADSALADWKRERELEAGQW